MGNDIRLATLVALLTSLGAAQAGQTFKREQRLVPPTADAIPHESHPLPEFSALDVDGDGNVSEQEASAHAGLAALFAELDRNQDGHLSVREYAEAKIRFTR